jgi:hypothetical protein
MATPIEKAPLPDQKQIPLKDISASDRREPSPTSDDEQEVDHFRQQAWGRYTKLWMWLGISLMWTIFELDNATVYNCMFTEPSERVLLNKITQIRTTPLPNSNPFRTWEL